MHHFLVGVFLRQISLCRNFHSKVGVGVISDVGVISVHVNSILTSVYPWSNCDNLYCITMLFTEFWSWMGLCPVSSWQIYQWSSGHKLVSIVCCMATVHSTFATIIAAAAKHSKYQDTSKWFTTVTSNVYITYVLLCFSAHAQTSEYGSMFVCLSV